MHRILTLAGSAALLTALACGGNDNGATSDSAGGTAGTAYPPASTIDTTRRDSTMMPPAGAPGTVGTPGSTGATGTPGTAGTSPDTMSKKRP